MSEEKLRERAVDLRFVESDGEAEEDLEQDSENEKNVEEAAHQQIAGG